MVKLKESLGVKGFLWWLSSTLSVVFCLSVVAWFGTSALESWSGVSQVFFVWEGPLASVTSLVRGLLEFACSLILKFSNAPGPFGTDGVRPAWLLALMDGSAACCTKYIRCFPFFFVQLQSTELLATTEGESSRGGSPQGHKAGPLAVLLASRHRALLQGARAKGTVAESATARPVACTARTRRCTKVCEDASGHPTQDDQPE